jgi:ABC-2 type transport system permease protein/lipopolysaccharide transport system permease protein
MQENALSEPGTFRDESGQRGKKTMKSQPRLLAVLQDIRDGIAQRELWLFLGWRDVKKHYSRSVIGPFWLTLSMGFMVLGLGVLYSEIFGMDISEYLPMLAIGLILWGIINGLVTGSCTVFSRSGHAMRQIRLPFTVYVFQFVWEQTLTFLHNFLIYIAVALFFGINPGLNIVLFVPALALILLNGVFISMILGPFCARFRDVPMIVTSVMQIVFFMTPIIWSADRMPQRAWLLSANPFYHFIEIVRSPLLGRTGTLENWAVSIGITLVMACVALAFFARTRSRIAYWS